MKNLWTLLLVFALAPLAGCNDPPTVSGVNPTSGPLAGGTTVALDGSNFDAHTKVVIAGILCSNISFGGSGTLTATTPAGPFVGSWDVEVVNKDGQRAKLRSGYTYTNGTTNPTVTNPTIASISPTAGAAGASITITGTLFDTGATVTFGSTAATNVAVPSATSITCTAPTGPTGVVSVTVTNTNGGTATLTNGFTYPGSTATGPNISTIAGSATRGFSGDGAAATAAQLSGPSGVAVAADSTVFVADSSNHCIRLIAANGTITTVAGQGGSGGFADGAATTAGKLSQPSALAVDSSGTLYIADTGNHAIRQLASGQLTTLAGTGSSGNGGDGAQATAAQCSSPSGIALDAAKNVIFADTGNNRIRRIDASAKTIANFAGSPTGQGGFSGDGGLSTAALFTGPKGVAVDTSTAIVYVADTGNNRIRKIDGSNNVTTFAGTGAGGFAGDGGAATAAQLNQPAGLTFDSSRTLYICDVANQRVRSIAQGNANIATFAGNGTAGFSGDGAAATAASLNAPFGVSAASSGAIVIADSGDGSVRQVH